VIRGAPTLSEALYAAFGVEVDAIVTLKTVTGVVGKDGMRYIWKPARPRDTERRLAVVARIAEAMSADGLPAAGPLASRHGERLIETDSGPGYLQPWLPGRHVRLSDAEERLTAVCTVAQVHRWSRRVPFLADPHLGGPEWQNVTGGVLPVKLRSKLQALHGVWGPAKDACPELAAVEKDVFRVSEEVVAAVEKAWQAHGGTCRTLCHRDLAPHNLLWMTRAWPVSLIDFDHAGWDDPFLDFMQLLNHTF
jgi:Ser/Thr protein kinase RdoA (MazF antagonist)